MEAEDKIDEDDNIVTNGTDGALEVIDLSEIEDQSLASEILETLEDNIEDGDQANDECNGEVDDSVLTFSQHIDSVFCVRLDPVSQSLCLSGGQDDFAYAWRVETGEVVFRCNGHKDSVTQVDFSPDSKYAATGDLGGSVKVWNVPDGQLVWEFQLCGDLEWLRWHSRSHALIAATATGRVWLFNIPSGACKVMEGNGVGCGVARLLGDGLRLLAGYMDGSCRLWNLKTGGCLANLSLVDKSDSVGMDTDSDPDNSRSVTAVAAQSDTSLVAMGTANGTVSLIVTHDDVKLVDSFSVGAGDSVECLEFSRLHPFLAVGTLSGNVAVWDSSTNQLRYTIATQSGVVAVSWLPSDRLLTASLDGDLRLWDGRSGVYQRSYRGHTDSILAMNVSHTGDVIVTAGDDSKLKVFKI